MMRLPRFSDDVKLRLAAVGWLDDSRAAGPLRQVWSGPDATDATGRLLSFLEAVDQPAALLDDLVTTERLIALVGGSRELTRQVTVHPSWVTQGQEDHSLLGRARTALVRVATEDLLGMIDVEEGGRALSDVADEIVASALSRVTNGEPMPLAVIALGKWGGREMNYWSDIDMVFVYEGMDPITANRTAAALMTELAGPPGGEGPVYHADADLRPEGSRGPLARSLDAYRKYYERWAEPWEFQALLKVRFAAGDSSVGDSFLTLVEEVLWPATIDPDALRSLRALKTRAEEAANPRDLKRAAGGIRDIEFTIQMLQLVHGRFDPELRKTSTLDLIGALERGDYVESEDAATLANAYRWLRGVEHRVQLWDLRRTHILPSDDGSLDRIARTMGYRDTTTGTARQQFDADLRETRTLVRRLHEDIYFRPMLEAFASSPTTGLRRAEAERRLTALGFRDVDAAARTFEMLTSGLSRRSRLMQQILPLVVGWLADTPDPDLGLDQLRLLLANAADHAPMITSLRDQPTVGRRLATLLGSSRFLGRYLDRIPELVPRLGHDDVLTTLRGQPDLESHLRARVQSRSPGADQVGTLRRFARRRIVRVAARDIIADTPVERTMIDLSDGADATARLAAEISEAVEGFAVIAMGRWGGRELSYSSDLDLLFVIDDDRAFEWGRSTAARFTDVIARPAQDGVAWQIDPDLRPEGRSGPLVRTLGSYRAYYERWAQTWEFQALIKARPVAGDAKLGDRFAHLIEPFVWRPAFPMTSVVEIRQMKARIEKERIPRGEDPDFHLKLGRGGLSDIEFLVQLLQLRHGGAHPALRTPSTVDALATLADIDVIRVDQATALVEAFEFCTVVRNRLYLQFGRSRDSLPTDPGEEWRLARSLGYRRRGDLREDYLRLTRRSRRIFEDEFFA